MAWNVSSKNGFLVGKSPVTTMAASPVSSDTITSRLSDKKIVVDVEVVAAGSAANCVCKLYVSLDGTNFVDSGETVVTVAAATPGHNVAFVDLSGTIAPYWKLVFNTTSQACGTSGTIRFHFGIES